MKFRQPSLWAKSTQTSVLNIFKVGGKKGRQKKIHSGGTHSVSRRYTLGGSLWDRKRSTGKGKKLL